MYLKEEPFFQKNSAMIQTKHRFKAVIKCIAQIIVVYNSPYTKNALLLVYIISIDTSLQSDGTPLSFFLISIFLFIVQL